MFGKLSLRDNLIAAAQEFHGTFWGRMFAPPDNGLRERADKMIEMFRLKHVADCPPAACRTGQQKLVDIAVAFMPAPRLVLLDEPAPASIPRWLTGCVSCWSSTEQKQGGSFVVIEHNMDFVMKLCHRIVCMVEGKVLAVGKPEEIRTTAKCWRPTLATNPLPPPPSL